MVRIDPNIWNVPERKLITNPPMIELSSPIVQLFGDDMLNLVEVLFQEPYVSFPKILK